MFYGGEERYQEYHIYVYFPAGDVYTTLRNIMTISFALMTIVVLFIVLLHFRSRYAHAMEISDQFNTIKAVGSIYVMNILIDLRHNRLRFLIPVEEVKDVDVSRCADDIFRHEFRDYIGEKYRDEYMAFCDLSTLRQRLSGKDFIEMEYQNTAGEWLSDIIIPKYNERGKFDSVLLLTKNINEEKKTELEYQKKLEDAVEREKAANSAKTDFLRRMSHDVRTPINVILGMLEIGERNPEDIEGQKRRHATAHAAADYLLELVNGVLTLNEAVDGDTHNTVEFCIPDEMNKVYKLMNPQAEKKSITLDFSAPDSRTVLYGNALYLRQIFINIVGNAVKFTQDGGRIVCIAAEKVNSDGKTADVRFTCSDNGCGMSKEFQTRMFEPFAKEDNGYDSEYGGMGLGLSLVKDLAQKMGGSISVKSEQGKGTVFEVVIPFKVAAGEKPPKSSHDTVPDDISGVNVLIAEDNKLNMEIAEYLLADSGANVTEAYNGREAADLFMKSAPGEIDIILMDMMMPVMSGTEAAMLIRSSGRRDAKTIPILAMTADLFAKDSEDYKKGGFNGFVAKPIDAKALVAAVARYVKKGKNTDDAT